ncbi:hypothetical protein O181_065367 [Austropuccinia psidii MF-1]|uniref:Uncharacterized protein n=1 Tax=Austropuccinia psidii MF-1 TaxID=1389203 RepID=A0A9Q3ETC4_9BASI|nr:hypothetical protein [Austropuccinia psidii MF-1]
MNITRGSKYSIKPGGGGLTSGNDFTKGKRKRKIPSGTEFTQQSAISQMQVPEILVIFEPELELSMSHSNRKKSHPEGSDRHIHEPIQAILHSLQRQILGNVAKNTPRSDEILAHHQRFFKEEEIVKYSDGWNPLLSKPQIKQ